MFNSKIKFHTMEGGGGQKNIRWANSHDLKVKGAKNILGEGALKFYVTNKNYL